MKMAGFIFSLIFFALAITSAASANPTLDISGEISSSAQLSALEKRKWLYVKNSLMSSVAAQRGFVGWYEKIVKYGVLPLLALQLLLKR